MTRAQTVLLLMAAAAIRGCATPRATRDQSTPAVHELARLQSMGQLDQARPGCFIAALPPVTDAAQARLHVLREERARVSAGATRDHARSVQQAMRASEESNAAFRLALEHRRTSQTLDRQGDSDGAALHQSYAMDLEAFAESRANISVLGARDGDLWTDGEAALLVEYATLRLRRAETAEPAVRGRVAEIEGEHPEIMEAYAAMVLDMYYDPGMPCG